MKQIDCENCPLSWEDRGYEGECYDCGCLFYGNYLGGRKFICKIPNCIKKKIADIKQAKIDKEQARQYEGIGEWFDKQQKKENAMRQAIKEILLTDKYDNSECFICRENKGKLYKLDTDSILFDGAMKLIDRYEELLNETEGN